MRYFAIFFLLSLLDPTGWSQRDERAMEPLCPTDRAQRLPDGLPRDLDEDEQSSQQAGQVADYSQCEIPFPEENPDANSRIGKWQEPGNASGAGGNTLGGGLAGVYGGGASGVAGAGGSGTSSGMRPHQK